MDWLELLHFPTERRFLVPAQYVPAVMRLEGMNTVDCRATLLGDAGPFEKPGKAAAPGIKVVARIVDN